MNGVLSKPVWEVAFTSGTVFSHMGDAGREEEAREATRRATKLNPSGSGLAYSTYLGGSGFDQAYDLTVAGGRAFVAGETGSGDLPTTSKAFDRSYNGGVDAFASALGPSGASLFYSTLFGGEGRDGAAGISTNRTGRFWMTGETTSTRFPTSPRAYDRSYNGNVDAFVASGSP